jgi:DNA-binding protein HU-beta
MNKAALIEVIVQKVGITKQQAENAIDTITATIIEQIKAGDEVTITGFGAFSARTRKGRIGVNPRNPSEKIEIPNVRVPKFKAGKVLKESLKKPDATPAAA